MKLVGMLDSPFVRRVAVALLTAEVPFTHEPLSVWRHTEAFGALDALLKAPTLILDDGLTLVESSVILNYLDAHFPSMAALKPRGAPAFKALGVALTVMEKAVQLYYENSLRGPGERSESWRVRVSGQLHAGLAALDAAAPDLWFEDGPGHADIATVCAFGFVRGALSAWVETAAYLRLAVFAGRAETLGPFLAAPAQDGLKIGPRKALA